MKTQLFLISALFVCSIVKCQLYSPSKAIQGTSGNNNIGIGKIPDDLRQIETYKTISAKGTNFGLFSESRFTSTASYYGLKGNSHGRLAFGHNYQSNGATYGVGGFITNLQRLKCTSSNAYAFGGLFGVGFDGTDMDNYPGKTTDACGLKTYISGSISNYPNNGIVAALWAQDNIKGAKTLAGYFDGTIKTTEGVILPSGEKLTSFSDVTGGDIIMHSSTGFNDKTYIEMNNYYSDYSLWSLNAISEFADDDNDDTDAMFTIRNEDRGVNDLSIKGNNGNVGIGITPDAGSYKLKMGGNVHMNNKAVNYVTQLHFNDNLRFFDDNTNRYLNFKYGNESYGGIKFYDGNGIRQGIIYCDGNNSNPSFGLLDADGHWAVHVRNDDYVRFAVNNSEKLRISSNGLYATSGHLYFTTKNNGASDGMGVKKINASTIGIYSDEYIDFQESDAGVTTIRFNVNNGTIKTKELLVTASPTADFVFKPGYKLKSLDEVEQFVKQNHHLPEIPSENEMKDGYNVAEMNAKLLQKIEELTLYTIEQQKMIEALKEGMKTLTSK